MDFKAFSGFAPTAGRTDFAEKDFKEAVCP